MVLAVGHVHVLLLLPAAPACLLLPPLLLQLLLKLSAAPAACCLQPVPCMQPAHLVQVAVHFRTRLVQRVHRGAAQLKLAAWLQRHALPVLQQPNDAAVLDNWLPAKALLDAAQQRRNLLVGGPLRVGHPVAKLLVLGAYPAAAVQWPMHGR